MLKSTYLALGAAAMVGLFLTSCSGSSSLSADTVEELTAQDIASTYGVPVEEISVSCPGDLAGVVGTTMICTGGSGGNETDVVVTVTSFDGSTILFELDNVDGDSFE